MKTNKIYYGWTSTLKPSLADIQLMVEHTEKKHQVRIGVCYMNEEQFTEAFGDTQPVIGNVVVRPYKYVLKNHYMIGEKDELI